MPDAVLLDTEYKVSRYLYKSGSTMLNGYVRINNIFDREYWFRGVDTSPCDVNQRLSVQSLQEIAINFKKFSPSELTDYFTDRQQINQNNQSQFFL